MHEHRPHRQHCGPVQGELKYWEEYAAQGYIAGPEYSLAGDKQIYSMSRLWVAEM